jgi:hypothetical protein
VYLVADSEEVKVLWNVHVGEKPVFLSMSETRMSFVGRGVYGRFHGYCNFDTVLIYTQLSTDYFNSPPARGGLGGLSKSVGTSRQD